jgi:hypothetical protein
MSDYQIVDRRDSRALAEFFQKEGQCLLPLVNLIETAQGAVDEVIDVEPIKAAIVPALEADKVHS